MTTINKHEIYGIFPIGICGMGKSTYSRKLKEMMEEQGEQVVLIERDQIFAEIRKTNSLRKTKKRLYEYYQRISNSIKYESAQLNKRIWIIFDTSNINEDSRRKMQELFELSGRFDIYFSFPLSWKDNPIKAMKFLEERVLKREDHPTFPNNKEEKIQTFYKLWNSFICSNDYNKHFSNKSDISQINNFCNLDNYYIFQYLIY